MNLLIIGGTVFLGRALVESALARGHNVTLFNRGQHNPELFPQVEKIHGDRDGGLDALAGRHWDAVIDTCGYVPRIVRASAEALAASVNRYVFISTISVYEHFRTVGIDEHGPLGTLADSTTEEVTGETYGPLKVLCEQAAEAALPGRTLIIRPGLIVGPHDPTDRFTYWVVRGAGGGEILAPSNPHFHVQVIDVRDLADWTIAMTEQDATGIYNATGPDQPFEMGAFVEQCIAAGGTTGQISWASEAFLLRHGVAPWMEMPLWLPVESDPDSAALCDISIEKAQQAGLGFRPLSATISDTLAWAQTRPTDHKWRAGISAERENELLTAWHAEQTEA